MLIQEEAEEVEGVSLLTAGSSEDAELSVLNER